MWSRVCHTWWEMICHLSTCLLLNRVQPSPLPHLLSTLWSHPLVMIFSLCWYRPDLNSWPGDARFCLATHYLWWYRLQTVFGGGKKNNYLKRGYILLQCLQRTSFVYCFKMSLSLICFRDLLPLLIFRILKECFMQRRDYTVQSSNPAEKYNQNIFFKFS